MSDTPGLNVEGYNLSSSEPVMAAPERKNWANDERVVKRIKEEVIPFVKQIREARLELNDKWSSFWRVYHLEHDEERLYVPDSGVDVYMPAGRKVISIQAAHLVSLTFPSTDFFDVTPENDEDAQNASAVKQLLDYRLKRTARVPAFAMPWYTQLLVTGNSPAKMYYHRRQVKVKQRQGLGVGSAVKVLADTPVFRPIDARNFYVYPENVATIDDAQLLFEDIAVDYGHLLRQARKGVYSMEAVERVGKYMVSGEYHRVVSEQLASQGLTPPSDRARGAAYSQVGLTEIYIYFEPEVSSYESEDEPRPFLITIADGCDEVLRAEDNPFFHQQPPYVLGRIDQQVNRFWGDGPMNSIRQLNLLLNAYNGQSVDCGTYALNPIVLTNPHMLTMPLLPIEPGVQWQVNDIANAVRFERPPQDLVQTAGLLVAGVESQINSYGGAPPVLHGGSAPGRAFRTATGVTQARQAATVPLEMIVMQQEIDVWQKLLYHFNALDQQHAPDEIVVPLTRGGYVRVSPEQLRRDYQYQWLASGQAGSRNLMISQLTQFLSLVMSPAAMQALQAEGAKVNILPLFQRIYSQGFGFKDAAAIFTVGTQPAPAPSPLEAPPVPQGVPQEVPPELMGGEFPGVRMEANDMAAALGAGQAPLTDEPVF